MTTTPPVHVFLQEDICWEQRDRLVQVINNNQLPPPAPKPRSRWYDRSPETHRSTRRPIGGLNPKHVARRRQRHARRVQLQRTFDKLSMA